MFRKKELNFRIKFLEGGPNIRTRVGRAGDRNYVDRVEFPV